MPVEGPYSSNVFLQGQGLLLESEGRTLLVVPRISGRHLSQDGENQPASSSGDCSVGLCCQGCVSTMTLGSSLGRSPPRLDSWMPPEFLWPGFDQATLAAVVTSVRFSEQPS